MTRTPRELDRDAITTSGRPESAWLYDERLQGADELSFDRAMNAVIVAPHPDDEVLGMGATMSKLRRLGSKLVLVAVTDGEASDPGLSPSERDKLVAVRFAERDAALSWLGVADVELVQLHLPDAHVAAREDELTEKLCTVLEATKAGPGKRETTCFSTWRLDGHPDHEAAGRAAARACASAGVQLYEFLVWAWHWMRDEDPFPFERVCRVLLGDEERHAKRRAIAEFQSQLQSAGDGGRPVLPPDMVARFFRDFEAFLTAL